MVIHIQFTEDILDIGRESIQILSEVGCNMVRVIAEFFQGEITRVIELIARNALHRLSWIRWVLLKLSNHLILGCCQSAFKTTDNGHRNNHVTVLVGHIGAT